MTEKQRTATTSATATDGAEQPATDDTGNTETAPPADSQESIDALTAQLEEARAEARDNYDRFLRARAEMDNHQKRAARQMEDFRKFSNERILRELLTVVDNLERAIASAEESGDVPNGLLDGVRMTHQETLKVLARFHVTPIDALGQPFDPNFHQAVMEQASPDTPEHTVIQELARGYTLHERLLRPAMVIVAGGAGDDRQASAETES